METKTQESFVGRVIHTIYVRDLEVDDVIMVISEQGDHIDRVVALETYGVFWMRDEKIANPQQQANSPCVCIRLSKMNIYRGSFEWVKLIEKNSIS